MKSHKRTCIIVGFVLLTLILADIVLHSATIQRKKKLEDIYKSGKITFIQEMKISRDTFPDDVPVGIIYALAVGEKFLYLPDKRTSDIKILTTDGKYIRSFGQKGKGPSDLLQPFLPVISGNNLVVWESGNRRFSFFDLKGKFLKHVVPRNSGSIVHLKVLDDGRFIAERYLFAKVNKEYIQHFGLELYSPEGELIKTLYKKPVYRLKTINLPRISLIILPFCPDYYWDVLPGNKIVVGHSENYQLKIIEIDGRKTHTFTHPFTPVKVTEQDKKDFLDGIVSGGPSGKMAAGASEFTRKNTPFPSHKPAFKRIISDCDGNILVFKYKAGERHGSGLISTIFDAFDGSGKFIGEVKINSEKDFSLHTSIPKKGNIFWVMTEEEALDTCFIKYRAE